MPNEQQRENLRILAQYLKKTKARFDMWTYAESKGGYWIEPYELGNHPCGTVCCAAGTGPKLAKKYPSFTPKKNEEWGEYIERVYGITECSKEYDWMFDGEWWNVDNTPKGAAKRIEWYLEEGVPDNHYLQRYGEAELCYK